MTPAPPRTDREPRGGEDDRLTVRVRTLVLGRAPVVLKTTYGLKIK